MNKQHSTIVFLIVSIIIAYSCKKDKNLPAPTSITFSQDSLVMNVHTLDTLSIHLHPSNSANEGVTYSSDNTDVASVNILGIITANKTGTANITATTLNGKLNASCKVIVTTPVVGISLPKTLALTVGKPDTLKAMLSPSNAINKSVSWFSSNTKIATVDKNGVITPLASGIDTIRVITNDGLKTDYCVAYVIGWKNYVSYNSGISKDQILSIAIDSQDNKWIGTYGMGVDKFDGSLWINYNHTNSGLIDNTIRDIVIDSKGNKWFATDGGVSEFDGTNWNSFLAPNNVTKIAIDNQGNLWFGTVYNGVYKFDGTNWKNFNFSNTGINFSAVTSIACDHQGNIWIGQDTGIVSEFDGINWITYDNTNSGLPLQNIIHAICIDSNGDKWIGIAHGAVKFDGKSWTTYIPDNPDHDNFWVFSIVTDKKNDLWFGMSNGFNNSVNLGAAKFSAGQWTYYYSIPDVTWCAFSGVGCIAVDSHNNKWFGTNDVGVVELQDY